MRSADITGALLATTVAPTTRELTTVAALDLAFAGAHCEVVQADGTSRAMAVHRWRQGASRDDELLFVDHCQGATLDVGCGPGRLTAAVTERGIDTLGIDISSEAVRQTRDRGAAAVCHDVFDQMPGGTTWHHVLLADGNIGLGGDPVRLLTRVAELLAGDGAILVEVARPGVRAAYEQLRLRIDQRMSPPFPWATVGTDTIDTVAHKAGLAVQGMRAHSGRHVATLRHVGAPR